MALLFIDSMPKYKEYKHLPHCSYTSSKNSRHEIDFIAFVFDQLIWFINRQMLGDIFHHAN